MQVILIAAMTPDRLIGSGGTLPWHEPEDLKFFKQTTTGHAVIMGRKTFDSVKKPLPNRRNIVITRDKSWHADGVDVVHSLDAALELCRQRNEAEVFVVGGAEIYALALAVADEMLITFVDRPNLAGDTWFPKWNPSDWIEEESRQSGSLRFVRYRRSAKSVR